MAKKTAYYGVSLALTLIFSYLETLFPLPIPVPGIKLGLANLVILLLLNREGVAAAGLVNLTRILLAGLLFGSITSLLFSLCGGALSLAAMWGAKHTPCFSTVGVSILGAIAHLIGQWLAAVWILGLQGLIWYLPFLLLAGAVTGGLLGFLANLIQPRLPKL